MLNSFIFFRKGLPKGLLWALFHSYAEKEKPILRTGLLTISIFLNRHEIPADVIPVAFPRGGGIDNAISVSRPKGGYVDIDRLGSPIFAVRRNAGEDQAFVKTGV